MSEQMAEVAGRVFVAFLFVLGGLVVWRWLRSGSPWARRISLALSIVAGGIMLVAAVQAALGSGDESREPTGQAEVVFLGVPGYELWPDLELERAAESQLQDDPALHDKWADVSIRKAYRGNGLVAQAMAIELRPGLGDTEGLLDDVARGPVAGRR
ncbi:MAG TPA: hypothetical protein VF097_05325 [Actinomycetota bacterium]